VAYVAVNKVVYDGKTLIDLSGDSVTPETLAEGVTAHAASGEAVVGVLQVTSKEEIVQEVIAALGTPVFGRVDADNNIILTGELANGTYYLWYEDENGKQSEICIYNHTNEAETYTNMLPLSINSDGSQYVGTNGEDGYKTGYRLNSSALETAQSGMCVTGFIPVTYGKIVKFKNITMKPRAGDANNVYVYIHLYDASFAKTPDGTLTGNNDSFPVASDYVKFDTNGNVTEIALTKDVFRYLKTEDTDFAYMRFSAQEINADSIVIVE
jgi:hypothetical protein